MMDFKEFTEAVLRDVEKKADGEFAVRIHTTVKNNSVGLTGIAAMEGDSKDGPCVYLNESYKEYQNGDTDYDSIVDEVYGYLTEHWHIFQQINPYEVEKWETARERIYAKLINAELNKEILETMPHRMFLDLAVVYYVQVRITEDTGGTLLICNHHMESWGQDEENLYQTAMENMRADGETVFVSMETIIKEICPAIEIPSETETQETKMYILTNSRKNYGASELLDRSTLRMIADEVGDEFIVLLSSVHECIILRPREASEYKRLADMVKQVNDTEVMEEERLSYHVYVYSRDQDTLLIAV